MAQKRLTARSVETMQPPSTGRIEVWDSTLPGFGLRVTSRGIKTFFASYRFAGLKVRQKIGRYPKFKLGEARDAAREVLRTADEGEDPRRKLDANTTFRKFANRFLEKHEANLKPSSFAELKRLFDREIIPVLGARPPQEISRGEIVRLLDQIAKRAPYTANRVRTALSNVFNWAIARGELINSPVSNVPAPTREKKRERVLTDDEIVALWKATAHLSPAYRDLYRLLILLGQRRGQTARINRKDVDFRKKVWRVPPEETKSGRYHEIPLPRRGLAILRKRPNFRYCDYFLTTNGRTPISGYSKSKRQLAENVEFENWRTHDIRRTVATGLSRLGTDRVVIEKILDHADNSVTAIYDRHSYEAEKREALETWTRHLRAKVRTAFRR